MAWESKLPLCCLSGAVHNASNAEKIFGKSKLLFLTMPDTSRHYTHTHTHTTV